MLNNFRFSIAVLTLLCLNHARAFDNVTNLGSPSKGAIKSLQALPDGIEVTYANGLPLRLKNVNNPNNGSPVDYKYITFDEVLQAYVIDVWRVGKQTVLLSKLTGAVAEVGSVRVFSPNKQVIFSTDCLEMGCYYQLTQWPSGKRLAFSQAPGASGPHAHINIPQMVESSTIQWAGNSQVAFEMPCEFVGPTLHSAPVKLVAQDSQWRLQPASPCQ